MDFDDVADGIEGPLKIVLLAIYAVGYIYFTRRRNLSRSIDHTVLVIAGIYVIFGFDLLPEDRLGLAGLFDDALVLAAAFVWVYRDSSPKAPLREQLDRWMDDPDQPEPDWYSSGKPPEK